MAAKLKCWYFLFSGNDSETLSGDANSCNISNDIRPYHADVVSPDSGIPWTTTSSEQFTTYPVPQNQYNFVENLKIGKKSIHEHER